jgi:hypothetical protein
LTGKQARGIKALDHPAKMVQVVEALGFGTWNLEFGFSYSDFDFRFSDFGL